MDNLTKKYFVNSFFLLQRNSWVFNAWYCIWMIFSIL